MTSEAAIERYLRTETHKRGGWCIKLFSYTDTGLPDRLVVMAGRVAFVELKAPQGGRLRPAQRRAIERLKENGVNVYLVDSRQGVDALMRQMETDQ